MANSNVPKFGNWENEEDVPYTAYFEKARKVRTSSGGKMTNPNDPQVEETSDLYSQLKPEQEEPVKSNRDIVEPTSNKRQGKSPLRNQAKASPLLDGNKYSYDGIGRSKPRSNHKIDESPEKCAVVPKFGDWDENNPSSSDGYTNIFNQVREERTSASNVTSSSRTPTHSTGHKPTDQAKFCCFSWGAK